MSYHVIIIGAGIAGLAAACSLNNLGISVSIVEKHNLKRLASPPKDGREIALTHSSRAILEKINAWKHIPKNKITPVKNAKIINGNSASHALHFHAQNIKDHTLGYMVSLHQIQAALFKQASSQKNVHFMHSSEVSNIHTSQNQAFIQINNQDSKIHADLIIDAGGRISQGRKFLGIGAKSVDFGKTIILAYAKHELPHHNTAYECFLYKQTLAVLPLVDNTSSLIITVPHQRAPALLSQDPLDLGNTISQQFHHRFGHMTIFGKRNSFPISSSFADTFISTRFALIGDAAHTMHPVTAHGVNLGLKAQFTLASQIELALRRGFPIHEHSFLETFNKHHRRTSLPLFLATNTIAKLYTKETPLHKIARKSLLHLGSAFLPAKRAIVHSLTDTQSIS